MKPILITQEELKQFIDLGKTCEDIIKIKNISKGTVKNYLKKYGFKTPSGFYSTGKKLGRKTGYSMSEEQKQLRRDKFSGKDNPFYGKKHSEETRKKMRENHADFSGENNPFKKACNLNPSIRQRLSQEKLQFWNQKSTEERFKINQKNIYEDISRHHWYNIINNAKTRNLEFSITPEYIWNLWKEQNQKCALSGISLNLKSIYEITASLDRIDSNQGYIEGNVQWIHKIINLIKGNINQDIFINMCKMITKFDLDKRSIGEV